MERIEFKRYDKDFVQIYADGYMVAGICKYANDTWKIHATNDKRLSPSFSDIRKAKAWARDNLNA